MLWVPFGEKSVVIKLIRVLGMMDVGDSPSAPCINVRPGTLRIGAFSPDNSTQTGVGGKRINRDSGDRDEAFGTAIATAHY